MNLNPLLLTVAAAVAYLYIFWCAYIAVMGVYRAHLSGRLSGFTKALAYPLVVAAVLVDVVTQYTLAVVLFWDWPLKGEHLVTKRLQRYIQSGGGWRYAKAKYVCGHLLDPFDPNGKHC